MRFIRSKSLPRSGHTFLERMLRLYFHPHMGYCEPYTGRCCLKALCERPCRYRLHKSHDFDLSDPIEKCCIIQYRAPVPAMHSHYVMNSTNHGQQPSKHGFAAFAEGMLPYYLGFFRKWVLEPDPSHLVISYDDLLANPKRQLNRTIRFVSGIPPLFGTQRIIQRLQQRPPPLRYVTDDTAAIVRSAFQEVWPSIAARRSS